MQLLEFTSVPTDEYPNGTKVIINIDDIQNIIQPPHNNLPCSNSVHIHMKDGTRYYIKDTYEDLVLRLKSDKILV